MAPNKSSLLSVSHFIPLVLFVQAALSSGSHSKMNHEFSMKEASVHDLQLAFERNQLTSRQLVEFYLGEIHRLNPLLRGVIEIDPDALYQADKADRERKAKVPGSLVGLHGIPILLKDNIATKDKMNTTAGSLALLGSVVPRDAGVVTKLRKSGAIILGKASLSEWAHYRDEYAPAGWCARTGQGKVSKGYYTDTNEPCWAAIDPIWWPAGAQIHYARPASGSPRGRTQNAPFGTCKATQNDVVWPGPSNFCLPL